MHWPETIRRCFEADRVLYSGHARHEMRQEEFGPITDQELYEAICTGEVSETYPDDTPYPAFCSLVQRTSTDHYTRCVPMTARLTVW